MQVTIAIPARWASARFPGKMLATLAGKPLIQHAWERAQAANIADNLVVLVDNPQVESAVQAFGAKTIMTSPDCISGTERIASALKDLPGDLIINVQGDECCLNPTVLKSLVDTAKKHPNAQLLTPIFPIKDPSRLSDPALVKVTTDHQGRALYFSRAPIPFPRDSFDNLSLKDQQECFGHMGIYGFKRTLLEQYPSLTPSPLERIEMLEQLRFMQNGIDIYTFHANEAGIAVDTPEDLTRAETFLTSSITS